MTNNKIIAIIIADITFYTKYFFKLINRYFVIYANKAILHKDLKLSNSYYHKEYGKCLHTEILYIFWIKNN